MGKDDKTYIQLYVEWKRLMSQDARGNRERCNLLHEELRALREVGDVSGAARLFVRYVPWR